MKRKLSVVLSSLLMATMLTACAGSSTSQGNQQPAADKPAQAKPADDSKTYTLKIGMVVTEKDPMYLGAMEFKKNVEERTEGKLKVEVYPSSQLGDTKDIMEQAKMGANVAAISDAALMSEIVPEIGVLAAPYVVDNYEEAEKLVTSDLFKEWYGKVSTSGYRVLSFNWYQGARHFMTNTLVEKPEDLKGLRVRTPGSPIFTDSINAMGANATALAWGEVYPGLQQKVVDGCEAQYPAIVGARLYEIVKYIAKTGHFQLMSPLVIGNKFFESLPTDMQQIVLEEAESAGTFASDQTLNGLAANEEEMKAAGVTITEVDITPFKEASKSVYEKNNLVEAKAQVDALLGK
ncbi:C4-dicarboxylate TRAP transporter substrate-binding protein [Cellulosilyticum sp. I15G10I2]|uniref:C4-dicarboxylate TRAP transporter substrate-binding protein n=1 Tax=Cellulosilyticum sp. I15G10I2 TaxID=1892843 RepID=UPI00085C4652|nr:C4-dicarboxylate TRAP transporter substrate-binding protein [Cellulosilyticum sp. I15G10I2]